MTTTIHWEYLAECLRGELADYGGLLHLFEAQQRALFDRDAGGVLELANEIERHANSLAHSRTTREQAVAAFAVENSQPATSSLRSLLPFIESDARPLIEALINEVNALLHRVRRTSRHNHSLLTRTVETHQEALALLRPNSFTKTYSPGGRVSVAASHAATTLRAAG
jgi:flagellar biosynthesis/type III secretory pathway chaperone